MSSTYKTRFYNQEKENDIKYNHSGHTKLLLICLNYEGTESPLTCIIDGKRIINEAKKAGVSEIVAMFDDGSTDLFPNKKNVKAKMAEMAASCKVGDYFVVYYSGHGTNVDDISLEQDDGKDQAFCLMTESGKYDFFTDDEASSIISKNLPNNIPCLFVVDACHSGSILDLTKNIWNDKKVFCISGCQDNQYSNDTGNGGQMTNILLAVIRQNQHLRGSKRASIQHIFNRMVIKNEQIEGKYSGERKSKAYQELGSESPFPTFLSMCFSAVQLCMGNSNIQQTPNYFQLIEGFTNFDDKPNQFTPVNDSAKPGQWINIAWNGGSDPTKLPFPF